jgi:hypothetical protein
MQPQTDLVIPVEEDFGDKLARRAEAVITFGDELVITDQASYTVADHKTSETLSMENGIKSWFKRLKKPITDAHKNLCDEENRLLGLVKDGADIITKKMSLYEEEREQQEKERREKEQAKHEVETYKEAFDLYEKGEIDQGLADQIVEQSKEPVATFKSEPLRGKTSSKIVYEVTLIEGEEHKIDRKYLEPTTAQMVKALEAKVKKLVNFPEYPKDKGKPVAGFIVKPVKQHTRRQR